MSPTPEAATLGSLLWDPGPITGVRGWLGGSDFINPWHAEVYRTLRTHIGPPAPGFPIGVGLALRDRLGSRRADLPRFAALAGDAPHRPDPVAYARLVLEASLRRQIATYGLVLRAGALATAAQRDPQPLHDALKHVHAWTQKARAQWRAAQDGGRVWFNADTAATARLDILLGADRFLATHPTPTAAAVVESERLLVGALLTGPNRIPAVTAIRADTLLDPLANAALAAIRTLTQTGQHIDAITIAAHLWRTTPAQAGQVGARLGQWAHAGAVRDLDHLATTVLMNAAIGAANSADRSLRGPTPAPLSARLADVTASLDLLGSLADGLGPTVVPTRSLRTVGPPAPRSAADDAFVLEVG